MATIRSFTSLEQSRKLAKILPIESADMNYFNWDHTTDKPFVSDVHENLVDYTPCWSLSALLNACQSNIVMYKQQDNNKYHVSSNYIATYFTANNPVDACYSMIVKLRELKLL